MGVLFPSMKIKHLLPVLCALAVFCSASVMAQSDPSDSSTPTATALALHVDYNFLITVRLMRTGLTKIIKIPLPLITPNDWQTQEWKNGGGSTHVLASERDEKGLLWQISIAEVKSYGPFLSWLRKNKQLSFLSESA